MRTSPVLLAKCISLVDVINAKGGELGVGHIHGHETGYS